MMKLSSTDLFVFAQNRTFLVRLPSFGWNFTLGLLVRLQVGDQTVDGRQVGTGNHEGRPAILLSPTGDWTQAMGAVQAFIASGSTGSVSEIERTPEWAV